MALAAWYLVAYDICDPARLRKVHYLLKREGLWIQRSVFLVHGTSGKLRAIIDHVATVIDLHQDQLRAWPVSEPGQIWFGGKTLDEISLIFPLAADAGPNALRERKRHGDWWGRVMEWLRAR